MRKYLIVLSKAFKGQLIYRSAMFSRIASTLIGFSIQLFLWRALLETDMGSGLSLPDMVLFLLVNKFVFTLTNANISSTIETAMIDGSISMELLRPISYKGYLLFSILGENIFSLFTDFLPVLLVGVFFLRGAPMPGVMNCILFAASALLGVLLLFEITYLVGLLAFWLQRCWFLGWYLRGFLTFFGGTTVPLWFYPDFLAAASYFLPFRYITFEPINLFLGKTAITDAWIPILASLLWLTGLSLLDKMVWRAATKKLTVNGG